MHSRFARLLFVPVLCCALLLGVLPGAAFAARGPVPGAATYLGVSLMGMTEAQARAYLTSAARVPEFGQLTVKAAGRSYSFVARNAVAVDIERMLTRAYSVTSTTTPVRVAPAYVVRSSVVSGWVSSLASSTNRARRNAWWVRVGKRMNPVAEVVGRRVNRTTTTARISSALSSRFATPGVALPIVTASVTTLRPTVTRSNLGKAIVVDLSERRVYLWRVSGLEKTYRCAVGMPRYRTPTGSFKVYAKVKNPTWRNPGSAWAVGMPAVIGPGPRNPLGTRALYINAPGIRIHGTSNYASIGTAASHGCVRLKNPDVENLYPRVPVGTPVRIIP